MTREEYYEECIGIAAEDCGLVITREQTKYLADAVYGANQNERMAFGDHCIPNPLKTELDNYKVKMTRENDANEERHRKVVKDFRDENYRLRCIIEDLRNGVRR